MDLLTAPLGRKSTIILGLLFGAQTPLTTLGIQLTSWITDWNTVKLLLPDGVYKMPGKSRLIGYILQRFRVYRKVMASQYVPFADAFRVGVEENIYAVLNKLDPELTPVPPDKLALGAVEDFGPRAIEAQEEGATLDRVGSNEQRAEAEGLFRGLAQRISSIVAPESTRR